MRQARGEREKRQNIDTELILALEVSSHKLPREGPKKMIFLESYFKESNSQESIDLFG